MAEKHLVLISGGIDSTTLLYHVKNKYNEKDIKGISFDYGQKHKKEIQHAQYHCEKLGIEHEIIKFPLNDLLKSCLLQGGENIPHGKYEKANLDKTVVPFRNGIFISILTGIAASQGIDRIWIGVHAGDHEVYPDCRMEFINTMSMAIGFGTDGKVSLKAPFNDWTKRQIVELGFGLNVNYDKTWSCYEGGDKPCGKCSTCLERVKALK